MADMKFLLLLAAFFQFTQAGDWVYEDQQAWNHLSGSKCNGKWQSPIDIRKENISASRLLDFTMTIDHKVITSNFSLTNTGHSIQLSAMKDAVVPSVTFKRAKYMFSQLHFHWADNKKFGSEHSLDGKHTALELHMVHYNLKFENFTIASVEPNGLMVLAVLLEEDRNSTFDDQWLHSLVNMTEMGSVQFLNGSFIEEIVPVSKFIVYNGSLTTPPCSETVSWVIATKKLKISSKVMNLFRQLKAEDRQGQYYLPKSRARQLHPLNGRKVERSTKAIKVLRSSASGVQLALTSTIVSALLLLTQLY